MKTYHARHQRNRETHEKKSHPGEYGRVIPLTLLPTKDLGFLGNVSQVHNAVGSEISSIWASTYMYDKLTEPLASVSRVAIPLHLNSEKAEWDKILYDTALFNRFGKWPTPYGFGARYLDMVFDGAPYSDLMLQELRLNIWRQGWDWLGEVFGGSYGQAEYGGLFMDGRRIAGERKLESVKKRLDARSKMTNDSRTRSFNKATVLDHFNQTIRNTTAL